MAEPVSDSKRSPGCKTTSVPDIPGGATKPFLPLKGKLVQLPWLLQCLAVCPGLLPSTLFSLSAFLAGHFGSKQGQGHPCCHRRGECGLSSPHTVSTGSLRPTGEGASLFCTGWPVADSSAADPHPQLPEGHSHPQPCGVRQALGSCGEFMGFGEGGT